MSRRPGYTLVEVVMAVAILSLVVVNFGGSLVACFRLYRVAVAEAELPIRARELREKLLFHIRRPEASVSHDGLLSARSPHIDTVTLNYTSEQLPVTTPTLDRTAQTHRLFLSNTATGVYPMDDPAPHDESHLKWLRPGGLFLDGITDWEGTTDASFLDVRDRAGDNRLYLRLRLGVTAPDGTSLAMRRESILVPLFNTYQTNTGSLPALFTTSEGGTR